MTPMKARTPSVRASATSGDDAHLTAPWVDIKRFAVHDGPGIRTTLFLQGCTLRCPWCHNPETYEAKPRLAYAAHRCLHCGECVAACPRGCHTMVDGRHAFDRTRCAGCGQCVEPCLGSALRLYGRSITVAEAVAWLLEDRAFYTASGGGVTLSGGEPLVHADFCRAVLARIRAEGIDTAVDTCGHVPRHAVERVLPCADRFLYDLKAADSGLHSRLTGVDNQRILENLLFIAAAGKPVEVRMILVPDRNMAEADIRKAGELLRGVRTLTGVKLLAYHALARSKFAALGLPDTMPDVPSPDATALRRVADQLRSILPAGALVTF
ncbi:MAG: glycyl-radical enzyme activating protein [Lentisphaerae bacterium]|nr:glycyl-radical enzyme activating protein [Lentisphaerota bacterium]